MWHAALIGPDRFFFIFLFVLFVLFLCEIVCSIDYQANLLLLAMAPVPNNMDLLDWPSVSSPPSVKLRFFWPLILLIILTQLNIVCEKMTTTDCILRVFQRRIQTIVMFLNSFISVLILTIKENNSETELQCLLPFLNDSLLHVSFQFFIVIEMKVNENFFIWCSIWIFELMMIKVNAY